jgi:hypothetical protein
LPRPVKLESSHPASVQIGALSSTDLRPATTCPCKAHTEAQAELTSWHKAYTEAQAAVASWRKAHMEAQAAVASWRASRQALLLDRAVAVREICCSSKIDISAFFHNEGKAD